jgi:FSR family fosmidomycin resistance protein-like MFS transporter
MGAISQPFFGWAADRYGGRWQLGLGVTWTIGFLILAIFAAQSGGFVLFLVPFVLASLGSAAFHPIGAKYAAFTATRQAATETAFFFLFGQLGLGTGPILSGAILSWVGPMGLPVLALLTIPLLIFIIATPGPAGEVTSVRKAIPGPESSRSSRMSSIPWGAIGILVVHTFCRSWAQNGTVSFIPKLFQDKGWDPALYGAILSTMWIASAISGVVAGNVADRWGRRQVVFVVMLLAIVPLYFLPITNHIVFAFILALLVGGLTGAPHSITVVIAQAMLPGKQATASGLILGLIFGMGALSTFAIGNLADLWTLERAMQLGAGMALLAGVSALALPGTRAARVEPEREAVKA